MIYIIMRRYLLFTLCILSACMASTPAMAEDETFGNVYQWHAHPTYSNMEAVEITQSKVYALSSHSLFSVDKQSEEISQYSKLTGLNGSVITAIAYNSNLDLLLICYENGQLDVMNAKEDITNISDLYLKQTSLSKIVNSIYIYGNYAYLALDFGIIVLDMKKCEIKDTYFIGENSSEVEVKFITILNDSIYAVSPQYIYAANLNAPLADYAYWSKQTLPFGQTVTGLGVSGQALYLVRDTTLWSFSSNTWHKHAVDFAVRGLCQTNNQLFVLPKDKEGAALLCADLSLQLQEMGMIMDVQYDGSSYWFASLSHGLVRGNDMTFFRPDGPINSIAYRMRFFGDRLYIVPGGRWAAQNRTPGEIMYYENGRWVNISNYHLNISAGIDIYDLMNVAQDPNDKNHYFVTSFGAGLLEMDDTSVRKLYTPSNSNFLSAIEVSPEAFTRTDGAIFDDKGYLWVLNTSVSNNIHILDANGNDLAAYNLYSNGTRIPLFTPGEILIDRRNPTWKWLHECRKNPGIILLQDNGTPTNPNDDHVTCRQEWYDQNGKQVSFQFIYAVTQDYDNTIWVGTNSGIFIIPTTIDFTTSNRCERIIIPRNDGTQLGDYLLDSEQINSIVVDGANRKWIGTAASGVFLVSPDGKETIFHFTTENSPLPSNNVLSIAIQESTGEVFIGTSGGLISYTSDAIAPAEDFSNIYAYPNPVYPSYKGVVVFKGLMANTEVRIVDANGNLVAKTTSNGGEAIWDTTNTYGRRVASGIYTAICNTIDGNAYGTVKVMIMN